MQVIVVHFHGKLHVHLLFLIDALADHLKHIALVLEFESSTRRKHVGTMRYVATSSCHKSLNGRRPSNGVPLELCSYLKLPNEVRLASLLDRNLD